jgi:hypothetical protein
MHLCFAKSFLFKLLKSKKNNKIIRGLDLIFTHSFGIISLLEIKVWMTSSSNNLDLKLRYTKNSYRIK